MEVSNIYELTADVFSIIKPSVKYGSKGEKVIVKAVFGEVIIVEGSTGRFPIREKELTGEQEIKRQDYNTVINNKSKRKTGNSRQLF